MREKSGLRELLQNRVLIADGAMGTLLHRYGIPVGTCGEELNVTRPDVVRDIHLQYVLAGSELIETNTYGANREKLSKYGLEDQVEELNRAGVGLAREAAGDLAFVVGSVGGILGGRRRNIPSEELKEVYAEQIKSLVEAGVDGLLLETFCFVDEAIIALSVARRFSSLPIICQLTIQDIQRTQDGYSLESAFGRLVDAGADIVGLNCYNGPANIIRSLESLPVKEGLQLSVYPNAGLPEYVDGQFLYPSSAEYFADSAEKLHQLGARIIGGCCGTTPEHIKAVASRLKGRTPIYKKESAVKEITNEPKVIISSEVFQEKTIPELVKEQPTVIVELDPPRDLDFQPFLEGAASLKEAGADAITMADNSLAMTRMSNMALGALVKEKVGIRPLVHITCRDRNSIGQQSHLMGLYALGIDHVLAITGDPTRYGDLPGASSVYDMTSFELIRMTKQLNEGVGFSGRTLKKRAAFTVAAAFNPNTRHLHKAVERLEKKVDAGADYVMSQPLYDHEQIFQVAEATRHVKVPIFIGIMPLTSHRNAEFLHNEVPGIRLSDDVRARMARYEGEDAKKQGVEIALELIDTARQYFNGIYLITPFMRYEMTAELTKYVKNS
ncbi:bifunctional homocysteine S-methyltransferase/methylenetetrahydrofolate reductase [Ammoniphilus sp. CFH 90114]|uniref:bifunctional homocysteine S-methyltransferase/methylenetetrahydrofolate reductase n=1 Tax=Ammoniphilus sp. CFH 90114 TaxID=2493665 RepID=UPI00100E3052|nr:bifunctional homocysteine S-methyltransferase/methylenetetrahydrofolate reductase [Ammoniphilus sp. CFH 90114]RXT08690.1 bifunctional homocysteine S-methyltransferase/methylenetetrahydrofolate reductase [Ammoniphilus sp. CFH 90114]